MKIVAGAIVVLAGALLSGSTVLAQYSIDTGPVVVVGPILIVIGLVYMFIGGSAANQQSPHIGKR